MKASQISRIDFFNDLSSPRARRWFVWTFFLFVVCCLGLAYLTERYLTGLWKDFLFAIFVQLASSATIILLFYLLYYYFIGPSITSQIRSVRPQDIRHSLEELVTGTKEYLFWGRSGAYFRAEPLRKLSEIAQIEKKTIDIDILLPDPTDISMTTEYARIRKSLGEQQQDQNELLVNVLATCICCAVIQENNRFLRTKIFLSKHLPIFRLDLSDQGALVTQDDPKKSAIIVERNSEFWEMFNNAFRTESKLSRQLHWDGRLFSNLELNESCCTKVTLGAFDLPIENLGKLQGQVAARIVGKSHRYR